MLRHDSINKSFVESIDILMHYGTDYLIRGRVRNELLGHRFTITDPRKRVLTCPFRYNNIFATIAEILWVFAGRDDLAWLGEFLPNAYDYSDDGRTWPGAYGPRLYALEGTTRKTSYLSMSISCTINQISNLVDILRKDPNSTQAVVTIYSPTKDQNLISGTKDTPCTMYLQFFIRDNKLHTMCYMRSNDCLWGAYNINVVEWTFLQEIIANIFGVGVGEYTHNAGSFHYYVDKENRLEKIMKAPHFDVYDYVRPLSIDGITTLREFNWNMQVAVDLIKQVIDLLAIKHGAITVDRVNFTSDYIYGMAEMCSIYLLFTKADNWLYSGKKLLESKYIPDDLRVAALEYFFRALKKLPKEEKYSNAYTVVAEAVKAKYSSEKNILSFIFGDWYNIDKIS